MGDWNKFYFIKDKNMVRVENVNSYETMDNSERKEKIETSDYKNQYRKFEASLKKLNKIRKMAEEESKVSSETADYWLEQQLNWWGDKLWISIDEMYQRLPDNIRKRVDKIVANYAKNEKDPRLIKWFREIVIQREYLLYIWEARENTDWVFLPQDKN